MSLPIQSVILDLDGTLLDSAPGILQSFAKAVAAVWPGQPFDIGRVAVGPPIRQMCASTFPTASAAEIEALAQAYRKYYDKEGSLQTRLFEGAIPILAHCRKKQLPMDVATNKPKGVTADVLRRLKINHFFRAVVSVDSLNPPFSGKTAMLRHLLQLNQLDPGRTLYLGDTAEDAEAAAECSLTFVWASYGYGKLAPERLKSAFKIINKLADLRDIL